MSPTGKRVSGIVAGIACLALTQLVWSASIIHQLEAGVLGLTGGVLIVTCFWKYAVDRVSSMLREQVLVPMVVVGYFMIWTNLGRERPMKLDGLAGSVAEFQAQHARVVEAFNSLIREKGQS